MNKVIIEARINEYAMRDKNPNVPWTLQEIVDDAQRVRDAGASILHYHARQADGSPDNRKEAYAEVIAAVREKTDLLILPTLGFNSNDKEGADRIKIFAEMAKDPRTRPDIIAIDTGSVNLEQYDQETGEIINADSVYENRTDVLMYCAREMSKQDVKIKMTCWDMGFVRRGALLIEKGYVKGPGYFLFHLTEGRYITGHPCTKEGIDALRSVLPKEECYWTVNCLGGNLMNMAPYILENGGNLAVGIGDYHYAELGCPTNEQMVKRAVALAKERGREPATPAEVKEMLKIV